MLYMEMYDGEGFVTKVSYITTQGNKIKISGKVRVGFYLT